MPRTTRAALRSQELAEESASAASVPLPPTPQKERVPLGEISDNKHAELIMVDSAEREPVKEVAKKGRKAKAGKKGNKKTQNNTKEPEVFEDGNQSSGSSAAEEARQYLNSNEVAKDEDITDKGPQATTSPAVNAAMEQLSPKPSLFNPELHQLSAEGGEVEMNSADDSFEAKIESRTPKKAMNPPFDHVDGDDATKDDSFVEQIKSRSPAKRVSRIEDSVEALDALEEDIEKASQEIPATTQASQTPSTGKALTEDSKPKAKAPLKTSPKIKEKTVKGATGVQKVTPGPKKGAPSTATVRNKPLTSRPSMKPISDVKKPKETRASLLRQGITPAPTSRPRAAPGAVPVKAQGAPVKRVSSVYKTPFQPTKSTKAPTQASFELPGEAISRKLKEQREERLKHEEEENTKRKSFKARPVRLSSVPDVKTTAATKARLSMAKAPSATFQPGASIARIRPATRSPPMSSSVTSSSSNKRTSSLTLAKRSDNTVEKSTAKRAPSKNPSHGSRQSSVPAEPRGPPTAEDLAQQKLKGKECFTRPKNQIAERERVRREKEEAAKKARIEAAERGRIASREWAEKQKARKAAEMSSRQAATA